MMHTRKLPYLFIFLSLISAYRLQATDLDQIVSGGEVEDSLAKVKIEGTTPYLISNPDNEKEVDKAKQGEDANPDFVFTKKEQDLSIKDPKKKQLEDIGYTTPGSFEKNDNYIEIDKKEMAANFRNQSSGSFNVSFIKNDYLYESENNIINRTISEGYKHMKGGSLCLRSDQYFLKKDYLNSFWSLGLGVGYNSGRAVFVTGERSDTTFRLWEIPVDVGVGIEIPIYRWFKISGVAGPSVMSLYQNRSDFQNGEKGKNKIQVGYGPFANAQFRFNLTGFNDETAYNLFTESKITNLSMNLEVRYHNYNHFQDAIKISGTSFGLGFTFEYL